MDLEPLMVGATELVLSTGDHEIIEYPSINKLPTPVLIISCITTLPFFSKHFNLLI